MKQLYMMFKSTRLLLVVAGLVSLLAAAPSAMAQQNASPTGLTPAQAKALSDLLNDPAARGAVVTELQRIASGAPAASSANGEAEEPDELAPSVGRKIAEITKLAAEGAIKHSKHFLQQVAQAPHTIAAVAAVPADVIWRVVTDLLVVMATTITLFLLLQWAARGIDRRLGAVAARVGPTSTVLIIAASILIDAIMVILAWTGGYLVALLAVGKIGEMAIHQSLYLNAFLIVEMAKVTVRAVLSPASTALRPVGIPDRAAGILSGWLNFGVSIIGYGQLLVVPIINQNVSHFASNGVSTLLSLITVGAFIGVTIAYRRQVTDWLLGGHDAPGKGGLTRLAANLWHWPVLLYLFGLFAILLARPGGILIPLLMVSAQVGGLIVAGMILDTFLKRAMKRGVHLPKKVTLRLPLLERRLNGFVPQALAFVRLMIVIIIMAVSSQLIGLISLEAWLNGHVGVHVTNVLISSVFILLSSFALWLALSSWVDYRLNPDYGSIPSSRERTLLTLLKNAVTILLFIITIMFVLSEIGIDIAPLIASAGVFGLAIGFGAQKLVQDIITGIFIQFENAINVGDIITVGGTTGVVERLTIRSVSLRDLNGVYHIVPFSSVDMVSNFMRGFAYFVCDMGIAYRESVDDAKQAMFDAFAELRQNPDVNRDILEDLQWQGLHAFGDSAVILRARIKCVGGKHLAVGRAYNEVLKRVFDERGIEIPFPHQTIYFGEDKQGKAPPLRVVTSTETPGTMPSDPNTSPA